MSADQPSRDDLARGMTVEIVQDEQEAPIVGDIRAIVTDEHTEPGGVQVELESGAVGRVKRIVTDE